MSEVDLFFSEVEKSSFRLLLSRARVTVIFVIFSFTAFTHLPTFTL